jgi:hypothetical protein
VSPLDKLLEKEPKVNRNVLACKIQFLDDMRVKGI